MKMGEKHLRSYLKALWEDPDKKKAGEILASLDGFNEVWPPAMLPFVSLFGVDKVAERQLPKRFSRAVKTCPHL